MQDFQLAGEEHFARIFLEHLSKLTDGFVLPRITWSLLLLLAKPEALIHPGRSHSTDSFLTPDLSPGDPMSPPLICSGKRLAPCERSWKTSSRREDVGSAERPNQVGEFINVSLQVPLPRKGKPVERHARVARFSRSPSDVLLDAKQDHHDSPWR